MPKMKTNKAAAKRFRVGGNGRLKRARANRRHILTKKSSQRKLRLAAGRTVDKRDSVHVKRMLGLQL